jgi:hypothetical protein
MTDQIKDIDKIMEDIKKDAILQQIKEKIRLIRERNAERELTPKKR